MKKLFALILALLTFPAIAQDYTARRIRPVTALPSICKPLNGDVVYLTNGTNNGAYECIAANTWRQIHGTSNNPNLAGTGYRVVSADPSGTLLIYAYEKEVRTESTAFRNGVSAPTAGLRAVGASGTDLMPVQQFSAAQQNDVYWNWHIPSDAILNTPAHIHIMWQPGASWTTGNYLWKVEYLLIDENGGVLLAGAPTTIQVNVTPANATTTIESPIVTNITLAAEKIMVCHLYRDVANDNGNDVGSITFVELNYFSNMLGN